MLGVVNVEQALCQGRVLSPLFLSISLTVVLNVALTFSRVDLNIVDDMRKIRSRRMWAGREEVLGDLRRGRLLWDVL